MASKEIKQKIVLEGEKEYSAALKSADRNLKLLRSALAAETKELGNNATQQQKNEVKIKSLQKQIKEQEKAVKTCQTALEEAKEKYGDNEEAVAKWELKLNYARATLAEMNNELEKSSAAIKDSGKSMREAREGAAAGVTATKSFADALENISSVGESVSGAIEGIFSSMFDRVRNVAMDVWGVVSETAAKANNWTDLGNFYGSSADEMQKWSNSISMAQGSFSDFVGLMNTFSFGGKNDKITEWFGVSDVNYTDNLQYTIAVLQRMVDLREEMVSAGTWDTAMSDIFGAKKSETASWFVTNWEQILKEQENIQEHGWGMGTEELSTMNDLYVTMGEIGTKWEMLKSKFAAGLGTVALDIMTNVSGALDAFADLLNAETPEEEQAALDALTSNIEEACEKAAAAIEAGLEALNKVGERMAGSENPYVAMIGNILKDMTEALEWIVQHQEEVKLAFEAIFGAWLLGKLAAVAGKLASIIGQIETIKAFKDWKIGTGGGNGGTGDVTDTAVKGGLLSRFMGWLGGTKLGMTVGSMAQSGLGDVAGMGTMGVMMLGDKTAAGRVIRDGGTVEEAIEAGKEEVNDKIEEINQNASTFFDDWAHIFDMIFNPGSEEAKAAIAADIAGEPIEELSREEAAEKWWDALRAASEGTGSWEEENQAYEEMAEIFGDDFAEVLDAIMDRLYADWNQLYEHEDLPADWWQNAGESGDSLTSSDISGFRSLPEQVAAAAARGTASGISGIQVTIDGYAAGRILAPYVGQILARDIVT